MGGLVNEMKEILPIISETDMDSGVSLLTEIRRKQREQTAKNAGYEKYGDYLKNTPYNRERHYGMEDDKYCPHYIGLFIEKEYVMKAFEDPIPNPITAGHSFDGKTKKWDWKCKNNILVKHIASCLYYRIKIDQNGLEYEWEGWQYLIDRNDKTDYFLLSGWDDRENMDLLILWLINKDEEVRGRPFWDRKSFSIRIDQDDQLKEMQKYEVRDKLLKIKELCNRV